MNRNYYVVINRQADGGYHYLNVYTSAEATPDIIAKALPIREVIRRSSTYGQGGARNKDGKDLNMTLYDAMNFGSLIMGYGVPAEIRNSVYDHACLYITQMNTVMYMSYAVRHNYLNKIRGLDSKSHEIVMAVRKAKANETSGEQPCQEQN